MQVDAMAARRWTYSMSICGRMLVPVHSVLKSLVILLTVVIAAPFALAQKAQGPSGYPSRLVKIIVPTAPGGNADLLARVLGERMSSDWGQPVVIENRPGAANRIGIAAGAKSPPDGYTLIVVPVSNLVMDPHIYSTLPYDVFRDLEPISLVTQVQNVLVINSALGIKTIKALVELAKAKPDELTFAAVGVGSPAHIASEMMNLRAGIKTRLVPYNGINDGTTAVLRGDVTMMFAQMPTALPLIQSGALRALGVASLARSPYLPDVPTISEGLDMPPFEVASWSAFMVPAGTQEGVRSFLAQEVANALKDAKVLDRLRAMGAEPIGSTPNELADKMRSEYARYGEIIRTLKIRVE
jgi:tripartite-type tricarboxylate transporter receptor subunit TctC